MYVHCLIEHKTVHRHKTKISKTLTLSFKCINKRKQTTLINVSTREIPLTTYCNDMAHNE